MSGTINENGKRSFVAGEDLNAFCRVKLNTTEDEVVYADAGDVAIGITLDKVSSGDPVGVRMSNHPGTALARAAGAFTYGDAIYGAADGEVDDDNSGLYVGIALETATAAHDEVEIFVAQGAAPSAQGEIFEVIAGEDLSAWELCYVSSQSGDVMVISLAQSNSGGNRAQFVVTQDIANGAKGTAVRTALRTGFDTDAAGADDDPIYLSDGTAGAYDLTKPTGTDFVQEIGRVAIKSATVGAFFYDLSTEAILSHSHADASEGDILTAVVSILTDAGSLITATNVEAALQEIFQHEQSIQKMLNFPIGSFAQQDGTALADWIDDAGTTPGWNAGDESFGIRWNVNGNPDPISCSVPYPRDLDPAADVTMHILCAKVGATVGDATTWLVEAFENIVGALYDADADLGGTSSAMTGDATSKTVQEETLTLALANITGAPGTLTITIQPTDGTLGTDDVILLGVWLEYKGRILTS